MIRNRLAAALAVVVPLGFATKFYRGAGDYIVNDYLGGVLYEVFWVFVVLFVWPSLRPVRVATGVFLITCMLETLQLYHPPVLEAIRGTFIGRTLIGTTFSWWDLPYYVAGCVLAVAIARRLAGPRQRYSQPRVSLSVSSANSADSGIVRSSGETAAAELHSDDVP